MNQRKFGRTNLHVSELCLDTAKMDWANDESTAFALLDHYHSAGGRFIQSAGFAPNSAPAQLSDGKSEETVGRWLAQRRIARDGVVLASRISLIRPFHGGSIAFVNLIRETCERSLARLRTKHLDLLICEWNDRLVPIDDILEAVDMMTRAGCVRYAVAGGFPSWRVVDSIHRSGLRNHARFEALQAGYSLANRAGFDPDVRSMCREQRLGFLACSPLAGGLLARRPVSLREVINLDRNWRDECLASNVAHALLKVLAEIADLRSATPAQIALAWVLRNPQVTAALISTSVTSELADLIRATDVVFSEKELKALTEVATAPNPRAEPRHV